MFTGTGISGWLMSVGLTLSTGLRTCYTSRNTHAHLGSDGDTPGVFKFGLSSSLHSRYMQLQVATNDRNKERPLGRLS